MKYRLPDYSNPFQAKRIHLDQEIAAVLDFTSYTYVNDLNHQLIHLLMIPIIKQKIILCHKNNREIPPIKIEHVQRYQV